MSVRLKLFTAEGSKNIMLSVMKKHKLQAACLNTTSPIPMTCFLAR